MDALLIRKPWIDKILDGPKTWEIRGSRTRKRGLIGLIESGSGTVVGVAEIACVKGALTLGEFVANAKKAGLTRSEAARGLPYKRTFVWVLDNPHRFSRPIPYRHPAGAVIWVKLSNEVQRAVLRQVKRGK